MKFVQEDVLGYSARRDGQPSDSNRRDAQSGRMEGAVHDELGIFEDEEYGKVE
jgi:hypothetical protein